MWNSGEESVPTLVTVAPTAVIASTAPSFTNALPIPVTVTFSEAVTGFTSGGVSVTNGTISAFTGSSASYSFNVTPSAQGAVTIGIASGVAQDSALNNNLAATSISPTYDSLAPVVTVTSPANNSFTTQGTVVISGSCETGLAVNVSGSGITNPGSTPCAGSTYSMTVSFTSGDGIKNISVAQTDAATNSATATISVTKDATSPAVTFTSAGIQTQVTSTNTVTFTGACESGLALTVSGGTDSATTPCIGSTWSYTTASKITDALRTYMFTQTDQALNSTSIAGTWTRDTVAPVVTITSPAANSPAQTGVTLAGACENGLGLTFAGAGALGTVSGSCSSGTYSQFIYFSAGDGSKVISVSQTDLAGNVGNVNRTFTRDTAVPAITQTTHASPYYTNTNSATFGGACEAGLTIVVSGADTTTTPCTSGTWSYTTATQTTDSSYVYAFTQTDAASNAGSISSTWVRKTVAPSFTFTSSSSFLTSGNSVTFAGNCVSGLAIAVSGSATSSLTCAGGLWSYAPTNITDGSYAYTIIETDQAGNVSTLNGTWTRSTVGPTLTITQTTPQITTGSSLVISGTCSGGTAGSGGVINITGAVTTTTTCSSTNATAGTWSYSASKSTDGTYTYNFATTDNFTSPRTTSASIIWERDTTPPAVTATSFSINGGTSTTTAVSYNPVSFLATDNVSYVTSFCLTTTNSSPLPSDSCWYPVNGSATNVTPSNSVVISGYSYNVGIIPQTYSVYLWLMDGAGNISTNTSTSGTDMVSITINPAQPPTISNVIVANSTSPASPLRSPDTTITGGTPAYIFWNAVQGGAGLPGASIRLFFTTDDSNWTEITLGSGPIANAQGTGCSLISGVTGCYKWSSPTTNFFRVRALVTDSAGFTAQSSSPAANAGSVTVIAGNTDSGLGGNAKTAMFSNDLTGNARFPDLRTLVVTNNGTVYFRDYQKGILKVDPTTGKQTLFIPTTGTSSGDGGAATTATLKQPNFIALDFSNRLLIFDYNVIRRVDLNQNPPTISTLIGGGSITTDTVANPLSLQITPLSGTNDRNTRMKSLLIVAPNNDVYFYSETVAPAFPWPAANYRIRIYKGSQSTPTIQSLYLSGTGESGYPNLSLTTCGNSNYGLAFDSSGNLIHLRYLVSSGPYNVGNTACTSSSDSIGDIATQVSPTTGIAYGPITADPVGRTNFPVTGQDGKIYTFSRENGVIYKFTPGLSGSTGGSFAIVAGINGSPGYCVDGTAALSCPIAPIDVFVTSQGQIYFMDKGLVRTVNSSGNIVTVMGQNLGFGDGLSALQARFGLANSIDVHHVGGGNNVVIYDGVTARIREFSVGGTINTIAGNGNSGGASANSVPANQQPIYSIGNNPWDYVVVDQSTADVFANYNSGSVGRLVRSSGLWVNVFNGGSTDYSVGDGLTGSQVGFNVYGGSNPIPIGTDGNHVLLSIFESSAIWGAYQNNMLKLYSLSNYTQSSFMGAVANPSSSTVCSIGTATSTCNVPAQGNGSMPRLTYDSMNTRWLFAGENWNSVEVYTAGGVRQNDLVTGLSPALQTFAFNSSANTLYYCGSGRLYKVVIGGSQAALSWPISSMSCTGNALIYDSTSNAIYFPFTQNGLFGVGMYSNP